MRHEPEELVLDRARGAQAVLRPATLGHVDEHVDGAGEVPFGVEDHRRIRHERGSRPIRSFGDALVPADRPCLLQRDGHRALVVGHRPAVRPVQLPRAAPLLADLGSAPPERSGGLVVEGDPAGRIGGVDGDAERLQELARARIVGGSGVEQRADVPFDVVRPDRDGSLLGRHRWCIPHPGRGGKARRRVIEVLQDPFPGVPPPCTCVASLIWLASPLHPGDRRDRPAPSSTPGRFRQRFGAGWRVAASCRRCCGYPVSTWTRRSDNAGQASSAHGPYSRSVRQTRARSNAGSTQMNVPDAPK